MAPFSAELARHLSIAALFDRDVHIRRAASAAFQEIVGRLGILAHGIDVLRSMDFFAVGQRRSAFLVAAPAVARHDEYREGLHRHLLDPGVGVRHWDPAMRELAAQSLRSIVELDTASLLQPTVGELVRRRATKRG